jgi:hypothetical protein
MINVLIDLFNLQIILFDGEKLFEIIIISIVVGLLSVRVNKCYCIKGRKDFQRV